MACMHVPCIAPTIAADVAGRLRGCHTAVESLSGLVQRPIRRGSCEYGNLVHHRSRLPHPAHRRRCAQNTKEAPHAIVDQPRTEASSHAETWCYFCNTCCVRHSPRLAALKTNSCLSVGCTRSDAVVADSHAAPWRWPAAEQLLRRESATTWLMLPEPGQALHRIAPLFDDSARGAEDSSEPAEPCRTWALLLLSTVLLLRTLAQRKCQLAGAAWVSLAGQIRSYTRNMKVESTDH